MMTLPYAEPYKIKMTEAIRTSTREEREAWIREARYNLFKLRSDQVTIDLLTDSGTGSMSDRQWAAMMTGDESYAGASSYFRLKTTVAELFGMPWFLPTHQGRAAENVIFSALLKEGDIVPGNSHFDTTKGHIEFRRCHAVDCTIDAAADTQLELPFKGEMDLAKLEKVLAENPREKIPCVVLTVTNNTAGGQPVSMRNIRETAELCRRYGVPLLMDSARFAENAYFIKVNEEGCADKSIAEIAKEMFACCDGFTASLKKDGHANMGGILAFRDRGLFWKNFSDFNEDGTVRNDVGIQLKVKQISCYGNDSYGGMSGRDIMALAAGLYECQNFDYLDQRVKQCEYLAQGFYKAGVKGVVLPAGGHGVYINMDEFFDNKRAPESFAGQGFSIELIRRYGIRTAELGNYSMEYDLKTPEQKAEVCNVVRFAINRSQLTQEHMDYVIAAVKALYEDRESIPNVRIVKGHDLPMRHFHAFLETYPNE